MNRNPFASALNERGQYVPMALMIMFTMVIFMVAMVNVYKVSRAKLKVQNIADAAALNLASQQAQAYNVVVDRNEWMNHMVNGVPSPNDTQAPNNIKDCSFFDDRDQRPLIPGVSCVENTAPLPRNQSGWDKIMNRHIFHSEDGAKNYAALIATINQAQGLFVQAYNSFIGASRVVNSNSPTAAPVNFEGLLKNDIPELKTDPSLRLTAWNSTANEPSLQHIEEEAKNLVPDQDRGAVMDPKMLPLQFKVDHDIQTRYYIRRCINLVLHEFCRDNADVEQKTLGDLFFGTGSHPDVGWLIPDTAGRPQINVRKTTGSSNELGVGVFVSKTLNLPIIGTLPVTARSKAYLVQGSGQTGDRDSQQGGIPRFAPTYWVKLAN